MALDYPDYSPEQLERKLWELSQLCYQSTQDWITSKAEFLSLDAKKKITLARLIEDQQGNSYAEKERRALLTTDYLQFMQKLNMTEVEELTKRAKRDNYNMLWETCRSIMSSKKKAIDRGV